MDSRLLNDRTRESACLIKLHDADCIQDCHRPLKPKDRYTSAEDGGAFDTRTRKSACIAGSHRSNCRAGLPSGCSDPYVGSDSAAPTDAIPCSTCLCTVANDGVGRNEDKMENKEKGGAETMGLQKVR